MPAITNLGVVLMERGKYGEARGVFQTAFELDSGNSDEICQNLRLAIARRQNTVVSSTCAKGAPRFNLLRCGQADCVLLSRL